MEVLLLSPAGEKRRRRLDGRGLSQLKHGTVHGLSVHGTRSGIVANEKACGGHGWNSTRLTLRHAVETLAFA
jgi:hypothetical protein